MTIHGKCVLTGVLVVAGYAFMVSALGMMNRPSDVSLFAGLALLFSLASLLPLGLRTIWRRRI
jgi:hypothetical protein